MQLKPVLRYAMLVYEGMNFQPYYTAAFSVGYFIINIRILSLLKYKHVAYVFGIN